MKFLAKLFFENTFARIAAVVVVFYFGIYKHDTSPDSVSRRFNKDVLSNDFKDIKSKTSEIISTISYKKSITANKNKLKEGGKSSSNKSKVLILKGHISDIDSLSQEFIVRNDGGKNPAECSDLATFSYDLIDSKSKNTLFSKKDRSLTIAQQESIIIERLLVGMFRDDEKEILIDKDYNFLPAIVRKYFLSNKGGILVRLKLNVLVKDNSSKVSSPGTLEEIICK